MDQYLTCLGPPSLSPFRRKNLAKKIGAVDVQARYIHYISLKGPDSKGYKDYDREALDGLLAYGEEGGGKEEGGDVDFSGDGEQEKENTATFFVSPRVGTISPWSSKATSIAMVCGFGGSLKRIERGRVVTVVFEEKIGDMGFSKLLYDPMTESIGTSLPDLLGMFAEHSPAPARIIELYDQPSEPREILEDANRALGLALDASEIQYLVHAYAKGGLLSRSPFDVELFMFAQVNSEHCRHKQFNASWNIDGVEKPRSLFNMIRSTHERNPRYVISAYSDNAAVLRGVNGSFLAPSQYTGEWSQTKEVVNYLAKVETHNHPTAVSPFPGAATGSGGEIRDEGSVGRGSKPKAGLCGFSVSDLLIPGFTQAWETDIGKPDHIASSLDIMLEAPIGSAAFNNEFGRPCTTGYFRTLLTKVPIGEGKTEIRGYHKPIMIAGGVGTVRPQNSLKYPKLVSPGSKIIVLGGPAMLIGLGGGAASSMSSAEGSVDLDFASVQRGNAEVQRRAQEVINACVAMGADNPITFIHDVGAGGLSNALPELANDTGHGANFELREIDNADRGMSPLQIWCCEAQERYVMTIAQDGMIAFKNIANRERCGYSIVGQIEEESRKEKRLILMDREPKQHPKPIDLPMSILFGKPPKMSRVVESRKLPLPAFDRSLLSYMPESTTSVLDEAVKRVLTLPAVGSKAFLITIGDRTVGGLTVRDQMVGPWQVPVADVSVTATSLTPGIITGEAMAMGEKPMLALISATSSARMAVAEALLNIAAADIQGGLERIRLSANWMAAGFHPGEGAALFEAVEAICMELCPELGISIPVGKDSMSMKMKWTDKNSRENKEVIAPLSLIISGFAPVANINNTWTPALISAGGDTGKSVLFLVDLSESYKALGGSALAQVFGRVGDSAPDVRNVQQLKDYFDAVQQLQESGIVLAYHDRSDGGLFTTLVEMMFAGRCGIEIMLDGLCQSSDMTDIIETLFNEELGAVFQVLESDEVNFHRCFATCGPPKGLIKKIGRIPTRAQQDITVYHGTTLVYRASRATLQQRWASTSYQMQRLRDNPQCADDEHASILDSLDPGLSYHITYDPSTNILPFTASLSRRISLINKPRVAILREQGVNGQAEMAFAFMSAGFSAIDVHMTDLISGRVSLSTFVGLAACGGFSYGDVLGAGQGWAKSVLFHPTTRIEFSDFFARKDTFTLGVCNGCQFLSRIKDLIPGAQDWPRFVRNQSEQYEARVCMVEVLDTPSSPSVFLHGMSGSTLPIAIAHGEGRVLFNSSSQQAEAKNLEAKHLVSLRYVDNYKKPTERYPANPNGSPLGITGIRTSDGKVLALMPHPERTVLGGVGSWIPRGQAGDWGEFGPWGRIFQSARRWVG